jgi:hypothetical protein
MHWGWLVPTATVVPAVITLATFMATVPCSPARFWAWRLRRHGAAVAALDPERHANQLEVLQQRTDYLANRVAAAQHIPTPWLRYVIGAFISSYVVALIVILVWQGPGDFPVPGPGAWVFAGWTIVWVHLCCAQIDPRLRHELPARACKIYRRGLPTRLRAPSTSTRENPGKRGARERTDCPQHSGASARHEVAPARQEDVEERNDARRLATALA